MNILSDDNAFWFLLLLGFLVLAIGLSTLQETHRKHKETRSELKARSSRRRNRTRQARTDEAVLNIRQYFARERAKRFERRNPLHAVDMAGVDDPTHGEGDDAHPHQANRGPR